MALQYTECNGKGELKGKSVNDLLSMCFQIDHRHVEGLSEQSCIVFFKKD